MLSAHELELLTAHIDGELTARQLRQVEQLLRESAEARDLHSRLEADASLLRRLPRRGVPEDLSAGILAAIAEQNLKPHRKSRPVRPTFILRTWVGVAAAAGLLLAVGVTSFVLNRSSGTTDHPNNHVAHNDGGDNKKNDQRETDNKAIAKSQGDKDDKSKTLPDEPDKWLSEPKAPQGGSLSEASPGKTHQTAPREGGGGVLGYGGREPFNKFERVEVAMPQVHKLHELNQAGNGEMLTEQLRKGPGFRLELLSRDASRGYEGLRTAIEEKKGKLIVDPNAKARLKRALKSDYAIYLEDVTPDDLAELLRVVGTADREAGDKKVFDGSLVVKEFSQPDRKELKDLLGIDPLQTQPGAKVAPKARPDIHKPLDEQTAAHVAAALEGKGVPRPSTGELRGMVMLLNGPRSRSNELKGFLETRRPARAGTIHVLLVLRNVAG